MLRSRRSPLCLLLTLGCACGDPVAGTGDPGSSGRPMHCPRASSARPASSSQSRFCFSVITQPGTIVLTRMPSGPSSRARLRVRPWIAALDVA